MKVGIFSTNLGFIDPVEEALKRRGHEVAYWSEKGGDYDLGRILTWCDVAFVEFCQSPLDIVLSRIEDHPGVVVAARMHRIEMYNRFTKGDSIFWDKVDYLFASCGHVMDRFMSFRQQRVKPKNLVIASTNVVDPEEFKFVERVWKPPYRLCIVGNVVPKKRQYTAIQYMHDLRENVGDVFKLDIVGRRGSLAGYGNPEYHQNCMDLIEDLDLQSVVSFYDPLKHSEMPRFMAREHAIISNSNEEGTHVAIAEAAMTGCLPIVNAWRGSDEIYPQGIAERFRSPGEFVAVCTGLKMRAEAGNMEKVSKSIASATREKYGDVGKYDRLVETLEGAVVERQAESRS